MRHTPALRQWNEEIHGLPPPCSLVHCGTEGLALQSTSSWHQLPPSAHSPLSESSTNLTRPSTFSSLRPSGLSCLLGQTLHQILIQFTTRVFNPACIPCYFVYCNLFRPSIFLIVIFPVTRHWLIFWFTIPGVCSVPLLVWTALLCFDFCLWPRLRIGFPLLYLLQVPASWPPGICHQTPTTDPDCYGSNGIQRPQILPRHLPAHWPALAACYSSHQIENIGACIPEQSEQTLTTFKRRLKTLQTASLPLYLTFIIGDYACKLFDRLLHVCMYVCNCSIQGFLAANQSREPI